jgi:mannose-6-phosphate isomerase-like protein (cupin superfamily)
MSDLKAKLCDAASLANPGSGPRWGDASDDLNFTLLSWHKGQGVAWSVNNELDVVIVAVEGEARVRVEDESFELRAGCALLIPKGAHRSISAQSERFSYFSIHRCRAGLQIKTS